MPPLLMHQGEVISLKRAVHHVGRSPDTVRRWCKVHGISRQSSPAAPLEISIVGLTMVQHGDLEALERLREGRRDLPEVRRYLEHLGLPK